MITEKSENIQDTTDINKSTDTSKKQKEKRENFDKDFNMRFKKKDFINYKNEAKKLKIPLAKYFRLIIEKQPLTVFYVDENIGSYYYQLNKIGININQIAKQLNQNKGEIMTENVVKYLYEFINEIRTMMIKINQVLDEKEKK